MAVALDLGRSLWTMEAVRSGHVAKKPALMAQIQVDVSGLKQVAWRNLRRLVFVGIGTARLA